MARSSATFVCQSCGAVHSKWSGKCDACGGWNTITEEAASASVPVGANGRRAPKGRAFALEELKTDDIEPARRVSGVGEFDRVCGGGLVPGSALLVGGDPGVGKSTLILQALAQYAKGGGAAVYISGEEAMAQVRLRASRMGLSEAPVALGSATCVEDILTTLDKGKTPGIVAIDSIQTIWTGALEAAPGTIAQVRTSSFDLVPMRKRSAARRTCATSTPAPRASAWRWRLPRPLMSRRSRRWARAVSSGRRPTACRSWWVPQPTGSPARSVLHWLRRSQGHE